MIEYVLVDDNNECCIFKLQHRQGVCYQYKYTDGQHLQRLPETLPKQGWTSAPKGMPERIFYEITTGMLGYKYTVLDRQKIAEQADEYDIHSDFNLEKHGTHFMNYLEVVILENGKVCYAVPSHTQFLLEYAQQKLNKNREQIEAMYFNKYFENDFMQYLCDITNAVAVWNDRIMYSRINATQRYMLVALKDKGYYTGYVPLPEQCVEYKEK